MEKKKQNRKIGCIVLCAVFAALSIAAFALNGKLTKSVDLLSDAGIRTGMQNSVLAYDEASDTLLVGAYDNTLFAFDRATGEKLWEMPAKGPFSRLIVRPALNRVYAANNDNHVYMIDLQTGAVMGDINVQRRVYDIDVTDDGSEIAVSAGVSTAKHNILVYTADGELLYNHKYRVQVRGLAYSADEQTLLLGNNRGEAQRIEKDGTEIASVKLDYDVMRIVPVNGNYLLLCKDGSYRVIDETLTTLRGGKPAMVSGSTAVSIGTDTACANVFIGTKEGRLYVMNARDELVFEDNVGNTVSDYVDVGDEVYITGYGDFVKKLNISELDTILALRSAKAFIGAAMIVFPVLCILFLMLAIPAANALLRSILKALWKYRVAYVLLIPTFVLLILFNYTPVVMAFTRAFTNWSKYNYTAAQIKFVGFENFKMMFTEGYFLTGLGNLGLLLVTGFVKVMTVPLLVAWLVYSFRSDRKKYIFRFLFVLPIVVPSVVSALLWLQIYDPSIGLLNQLLGKLGLESLQRVWLGNEKTAIWAIIFMGFPFINALAFLLYYGGLTSIDQSMYEAARIDGANRSRIFFGIQIPLIMPQIKLMLVLTFIGTVQDFSSIYLLTAGGPGTSTYVPGLELYFNATTFGRYGYACALGIVMFLFIMIGTIINLRLKAENN